MEQKRFSGMTKADWDAIDWKAEENTANGQFGIPDLLCAARVLSSMTDHCGPAKRANKNFRDAAKSLAALKSHYGSEWGGFTDKEKDEKLMMHLHGCAHHLRNIGYRNGMRAVAEHIRPLIASTIQEAQDHGVQCVTGEVGAGLRSILKFFGNTTSVDFRSVGSEFKRWCATGGGGEKDTEGNWIEGTQPHPEYASMPFLSLGRCDLGNRQDGAAEQSWKMDTHRFVCVLTCDSIISYSICFARAAMLDFILEYNWSATDINFYAAITLFLESIECESERVLYALLFHQVFLNITSALLL